MKVQINLIFLIISFSFGQKYELMKRKHFLKFPYKEKDALRESSQVSQQDIIRWSIEYLHPCPMQDFDCQKQLWQNSVPYMVSGVEEFDVPPMDPLIVRNVTAVNPNLLSIYLVDGKLKGFKNIVYQSVKSSFIKDRVNATIEVLVPSLSITGISNITGRSDIIPGLLNTKDPIRHEGYGKVKIINLKVTLFLNGKIKRNKDGQIKTKLKMPINYLYKINGPVLYYSKNITIGKEDITNISLAFLNAHPNGKIFCEAFGGPAFKEGFKIISDLLKKFFKNVPAKEFIADNLEQYLNLSSS